MVDFYWLVLEERMTFCLCPQPEPSAEENHALASEGQGQLSLDYTTPYTTVLWANLEQGQLS